MTALPTITRKQEEIIKLLYSYRFLNRIQIQTFLNHKDKKTINVWLRDLKAKGYIDWIYSTHFAEKTKPAIYYLSRNAIRYLKTFNDGDIDHIPYPPDELRKRYREAERSQTYIDRCLVLADCAATLGQARDEGEGPQSWYFSGTEADYLSDGYYHFLADNELIHPQLCFSKEVYESNEPETEQHYLLEIFDATLPRYRIKKRLSNYVEYLDDEGDDWQEQTDGSKLPIILLVCPRTSDLIYAKRRTRGLLADIWDEDEVRPHIRFTTSERLRIHGVLSEIWEEA